MEAANKRVRDYSGAVCADGSTSPWGSGHPAECGVPDELTRASIPVAARMCAGLIETCGQRRHRDDPVSRRSGHVWPTTSVVIDRRRPGHCRTNSQGSRAMRTGRHAVRPELRRGCWLRWPICSDPITHTAARSHRIRYPRPDRADTLVEVVRRTADAGIQLADITFAAPSLPG